MMSNSNKSKLPYCRYKVYNDFEFRKNIDTGEVKGKPIFIIITIMGNDLNLIQYPVITVDVNTLEVFISKRKGKKEHFIGNIKKDKNQALVLEKSNAMSVLANEIYLDMLDIIGTDYGTEFVSLSVKRKRAEQIIQTILSKEVYPYIL